MYYYIVFDHDSDFTTKEDPGSPWIFQEFASTQKELFDIFVCNIASSYRSTKQLKHSSIKKEIEMYNKIHQPQFFQTGTNPLRVRFHSYAKWGKVEKINHEEYDY